MKKTYRKYELLRTCFSRILVTDEGTNIVQNTCLTEQQFLEQITTACLWNFSFLEICMHLISNFTCKDIQSLKESRVVAMESFSIELKEAFVHKCSKEKRF